MIERWSAGSPDDGMAEEILLELGDRIRAHPWWRNLLGPEADRIADHVLARIQDEGPLGSADFDHPGKRGSWWGWKPQKAALDHLWRTGRLAVVDRVDTAWQPATGQFPAFEILSEPPPS